LGVSIAFVPLPPPPMDEGITTRGPGLLILCGILGAFTVFIVLARFWSRFISQKNAGVEEAVFAAAVPFVIGEIIATVLGMWSSISNTCMRKEDCH